MANKNEFLPFANTSTSNVIDQNAYDTLDSRKTGFSSGVAKSAQLNKVWRQSSIVSSAIAQFIADTNKVDVVDDGDVPKLAVELGKAISAGASGVKSFNGVVGAVTISEGNNITIQKNGNDFKINAAGGSGGVTSVNGKTGVVTLNYSDVNAAPIASPAFTGTPTAPTPTKGDSTTKLATTAFVSDAIGGISAGVVSLNNISGAVNLVAGSNVTITPAGKNITIAASGGGGVTSVNGKTGAVTLNNTDVGAPSTAGVGATGTWNIGISGNAATSSAITSGEKNVHFLQKELIDPYYLWGQTVTDPDAKLVPVGTLIVGTAKNAINSLQADSITAWGLVNGNSNAPYFRKSATELVNLGLASGTSKAWVNFNGLTGAKVSGDNISSTTKLETGAFQINYTKPMSNNIYAVMSGVSYKDDGIYGSTATVIKGTPSTNFVQIETKSGNKGDRQDVLSSVYLAIYC